MDRVPTDYETGKTLILKKRKKNNYVTKRAKCYDKNILNLSIIWISSIIKHWFCVERQPGNNKEGKSFKDFHLDF